MTVLITAQELDRRLRSGTPPLLLDARWNLVGRPGHEEFVEGHLPGSVFVSVDEDLSSVRPDGLGGRHPLPEPAEFGARMRELGVSAGREVVCLDGAGSRAASRLWWMLSRAGHQQVHILDGGYAAWRELGGEVETGPGATPAAGDWEPRVTRWPDVVRAEDLESLMAQGATLWDVRAPERYRGDSEPVDPVGGHIPGARNLPEDANHRPGGRFLDPDELAQRLAQVRPGDVVYCGSGATAAQVVAALEVVGTPGVRMYAGSWSDWVGDPSRPVATGDEPG